MSYKKSQNLKRGHAKMERIGRVKAIVNCVETPKTSDQIADELGVSRDALQHSLLAECIEYGIIERDGRHYVQHKPSNIESLKADMMGATA